MKKTYYVVLDKLIYKLPKDIFLELTRLQTEFKKEETAGEGYYEYMAYCEYQSWIKQNLNPLSEENHNFDLQVYENRYKRICDCEKAGYDLPF